MNQFDPQLTGGRLIHQMSALNTEGRLYAMCDKHKTHWQEVNISFDIFKAGWELQQHVRETAQRIIDACPFCKEEQRVADEYQTTRWPAGAEL